jgi:hypothetical protein
MRLREGVSIVATLLAGRWLLGEDSKKPEEPPPKVKGEAGCSFFLGKGRHRHACAR